MKVVGMIKVVGKRKRDLAYELALVFVGTLFGVGFFGCGAIVGWCWLFKDYTMFLFFCAIGMFMNIGYLFAMHSMFVYRAEVGV